VRLILSQRSSLNYVRSAFTHKFITMFFIQLKICFSFYSSVGKMYFLYVEKKVRKPPKVGFPFRCYADSHYTSLDRQSPVICKVKEWPSSTEAEKVWRLYHFYCGKVRYTSSSSSSFFLFCFVLFVVLTSLQFSHMMFIKKLFDFCCMSRHKRSHDSSNNSSDDCEEKERPSRKPRRINTTSEEISEQKEPKSECEENTTQETNISQHSLQSRTAM
jgi:hypothetical protein